MHTALASVVLTHVPEDFCSSCCLVKVPLLQNLWPCTGSCFVCLALYSTATKAICSGAHCPVCAPACALLQRDFGKCGEAFITDNNYCAATCGLAPCKTADGFVKNPMQPANACTDVPPDQRFSCEQQVTMLQTIKASLHMVCDQQHYSSVWLCTVCTANVASGHCLAGRGDLRPPHTTATHEVDHGMCMHCHTTPPLTCATAATFGMAAAGLLWGLQC